MALRWIEGFELYGTGTGAATQTDLEAGLVAKWNAAWFTSPAYLAQGRVLGKCLHCQGNSGVSLRKQFSETKTTWIVGFAMKGNTGNGDDILQILNALDLETNASGKIYIKRSSTTLGASGDSGTEVNVFSDDAWHYIELKVVIDSVNGSWELRVDGVESASGSGVNTGTPASAIDFELDYYDQYLDDIYICDGDGTANNDFIGPAFVEGLLPTSDGNSSDWTPSSGTDNYALIDENPSDLDGTDNVSTTTQDAKDTYGYADLTSTPDLIRGVQVNTDARKLTVANQDLAHVARSGTTETTSTSIAVTDETDFATVSDVFEQDPNTSAAWTPAGVNAAEFGFKKTS